MEKDVAVPVLSKGSVDTLTSVESILWYIISFSLRNPGMISDIDDNNIISFRHLEAQYGHDPSQLAANYGRMLTNAALSHFPDMNISADVSIDNVQENTFTLTVAYVDEVGIPILSLRPIKVTPRSIDIILNSIAR